MSSDMQTLARRGAELRLAELDEERRALLRAFPDLKFGTRLRSKPNGAEPILPSVTTPKRRSMSPKQRRAISERMSRYWAQRRADKARA